MSVLSNTIGLLSSFLRIIPLLAIILGLFLAYGYVQNFIEDNCGDGESVPECIGRESGEGTVNTIIGAITGVGAGIISGGGRLAGGIRNSISNSLKIPLPSFRFGD